MFEFFPIWFYALGTLAVMVVLAVVNSALEVEAAQPRDVGPSGLPLFFAQAHRIFLDLDLIESNQAWANRVRRVFGAPEGGEDPESTEGAEDPSDEGEVAYDPDALMHAGDQLRLLGRPGMSLLAAATLGFTLDSDWTPDDLLPPLRAGLARYRRDDLGLELEEVERLEDGSFRGRLTVGPWTRHLDFRLPGDVYREANTVLEAEGFRVMQFDTAGLRHAFALMQLPLARKMFQSATFALVDPPGGEPLVEGGRPEQWYTWLY